jgi:predicted DNA-binding transcriptional regulator YafY
VIETTERLLAVLAALQSRPVWTGPELATRLDVTVRTVRRDIDRLRRLGYAIDSDLGPVGGYRLGFGGTALPPLMIDADEAVAVAISLRAAGDSVTGIGAAAARVLSTLEQMVPAGVRQQVAAIEAATLRLTDGGAAVDPAVLVAVSHASRERDVLRIAYTDGRGRRGDRSVEPFRAVHTGRRWYLVARDQAAARRADDDGWRTFRLDRISAVTTTGHRFERIDPPDPALLVQRAISTAPYAHQARVEVLAPIARVSALVPSTTGVLEETDGGTTILTTGADDLDLIVLHLAHLDLPFRVIEPGALRERLLVMAERLRTAAGDERSGHQ